MYYYYRYMNNNNLLSTSSSKVKVTVFNATFNHIYRYIVVVR